MCVRTCAKHWGHRRDIACKALPRGTDLAREGAGRVGMCSRWAIRGGCSEEVSFEQQPHERRRWPGRVRGTPPDGMSQGLRDMKGWPRSPGPTPLASSGRSPCAGSGVHAGLCLRGPGQCGLPWRGRWGRRGRGSPGGLALIGTLEPVVDTSRGLLPSACQVGSGRARARAPSQAPQLSSGSRCTGDPLCARLMGVFLLRVSPALQSL